jgi:phosphoribosyl 1,2-cyclic phosphate phosphodiesterase
MPAEPAKTADGTVFGKYSHLLVKRDSCPLPRPVPGLGGASEGVAQPPCSRRPAPPVPAGRSAAREVFKQPARLPGAMSMRITMLGSGTSTGVPVIGCTCGVCTSDNPRNKRWRPGLKLEIGGGVVLVDTPTDLREQALRFGLPRVDAVIFTHSHADHVFGLDDVRIFNFRQRSSIPCYGSAHTLAALRSMFAYVFENGQEGGGRPQLELIEVQDRFAVLGQEVVPVPVWHGELEVFGYRLGSFAYVTDCNSIPEASFRLLTGVEVLILDALRYRPHSTHFSVEQALTVAARIGASRTILTHLAHEIDHDAPAVALPEGVEFGYDGLVLDAE